jgi:hypothetical protein
MGLQRVFAWSSLLYTRRLLSLLRTTPFTRLARLRVVVLLWRDWGHHKCHTFGAEVAHSAAAAMGGLRGLPCDPSPSSAGAFSMSGVPDRFAPSVSKPLSAESTVGKSAPAKQHSCASSKVSVPVRLSSSIPKLMQVVQIGEPGRLWRKCFRRPYSPTVAPRQWGPSRSLDGLNLRTTLHRVKMGFGTSTNGPHWYLSGRKTCIALNDVTVKRLAYRGNKVKSCVNREIIGGCRTIKGGLTFCLPYSAAAVRNREAYTFVVSL